MSMERHCFAPGECTVLTADLCLTLDGNHHVCPGHMKLNPARHELAEGIEIGSDATVFCTCWCHQKASVA
jgi:hypothetical protein